MKKLFVLLWVLLVSISFAQAQQADLIPKDPDVRIGKLDNGLVYYIRKNAKPENRVELRLAVNTGSILETDEEQGLAHFTEHMCFNGTTHFPKNELVQNLERMGIKFGADINAYTGFDETVYMLQIPVDKPELLQNGFQIIEDWAHEVTMSGEEIDKERGVIIEELRMGLGADDRMRKKAFPVIFQGSKYADRLPIGKKPLLETFKHETIRNFYKKWYRPNLQAVVVVGDIDVDDMEKRIIKHFGHIQNPANAPMREVVTLPDNNEPLISIETDPEASGNSLLFFYKHPKQKVVTINDFAESLKADLFTEIVNERLEEIGMKADAPYMYAQSSYGDFLTRTQDAFLGYVAAKENQIEKSYEILLTEIERAKRFGVTESELERAKKRIYSEYEKSAKEFDKIESATLAMNYVYNFLANKPIPNAVQKFEMVKKLLDGIKLQDVNILPAKFITDKNLVIMVNAPQKAEVKVPTKEQLLKITSEIKIKDLKPLEEKVTATSLMANLPEIGKITSEVKITEFDATELTLSNGIKVVLKKTDFKNNEILFSAVSPGGHSLVSNDDFMSANFASSIMGESGVAEFSKTDLSKMMSGKDLEVTAYIDEIKEGITGKSSPADLETAMQLIHLRLTKPRKDDESFKSFMSKTKNQLKFVSNNPMYAFYQKFIETVTSNDPRSSIIPSNEQLEKVSLDKAFEIYSNRFEDAGDFTFVFVGSFDEAIIKDLISKYIATLPTKNRKETWKDISPKFPEKTTEIVMNKGIDEKGMIGLAMKAPFEWSEKNKLVMYAMNQVLNIKLREKIREDEGGTYGIGAQMVPEKYPSQEVSTMIVFGSDPKKQEKYVKLILAEMNKMIKNGVTDDDLAKVKETMIRERETNLKKNDWYKARIENMYFYNDPKNSISQFDEIVKSITKEDLVKAAGMYLKPEHYVRVLLKPEKK